MVRNFISENWIEVVPKICWKDFDKLLFKTEQSKPSLLMNDNYNILIDIITDKTYSNLTYQYLPYINRVLLKIVDNLSIMYRSLNSDIYSVDYKRYEYTSKLHNLELNILYCLMKEENIELYVHRHAGMNYLLSYRRYNPEHIQDLMDLRHGRTDYLTTIDVQGHEIKMLEGNRMCFTLLQFINFNENDDIVIFESIRRRHGYTFYQELIYYGHMYKRTIKFRDILDKRCPYTIYIKDSDFDSAIKERYRVLKDRSRQKTIEESF